MSAATLETAATTATTAIHDALVRPYPGHKIGSALAESWTLSPDGLVYEFRLRPGLRFHNGDPITAEDVLINQVRQGEQFIGDSLLVRQRRAAFPQLRKFLHAAHD